MRPNSTYVYKPGEKYIVIPKDELPKYIEAGYIHGTGLPKSNYDTRVKKIKETKKNKYGDEKYNNIEKSKQTQQEKYGGWYVRTDEFKDKSKETSLLNYGVEHPMKCPEVNQKLQAPEIKEKATINREKTMIKRYGGFGNSVESIREKQEASMVKKWGVKHYAQTGNIVKCVYKYNDEVFDSLPELALWVYAKDHNEDIERTPIRLEYTYNDNVHYYFPDFKYKGELLEIKGSHFFKEDGTMCNPYDHSQDDLYEAKHQCGLQNGVKFWRYDDYIFAVNYFNKNYRRENYLIG